MSEETVQPEQESVQPERYVESEDYVPNPTDQYGQVLTHGNIDQSQSMEFATPLFRQMHTGTGEDGELTQDEYFLTPGQRAAALTPDDVEDPAELTVGSPAATSGPIVEPAEVTPAEQGEQTV